MENKIKEIVIEPSKIFEDSIFKIKIKAIRYMTCKEMKTKTCKEAKTWTCREVDGKWENIMEL